MAQEQFTHHETTPHDQLTYKLTTKRLKRIFSQSNIIPRKVYSKISQNRQLEFFFSHTSVRIRTSENFFPGKKKH